jgi:protease-4
MRFIFRSIKWFLVSLWRLINFARLLIINLIFFTLVIGLIIGLRQEKEVPAPQSGALVLNLAGNLVEDSSTPNPADQLMSKWISSDDTPREMKISDIEYVLKRAKTDPSVKGIVLKTQDLSTTSVAKLTRIATALDDFRKSHKPVVSVGNFYQQNQYLLAAHADTILLDPAGAVAIQGLETYNFYFKSALDKFNITPHIFRVGTYKSFVEPYIRDDMSPEAKDANRRWLTEMWQQYVTNVASARHVAPDIVSPSKDQVLARLTKAEGNAAQYALDQGLVDQLATYDDVVDTVRDFAGADGHSYKKIDFQDYLKGLPPQFVAKATHPSIGLLVAQGALVDGLDQENTINGDTFAAQIRQATYDKNIKALVLRVDSPGGSAFAADQIRTALLAFQATGRPVIVSMGSLAASGGYWISADADKIIAEPSTLTGSIGVFGMFMTADKALNTLGVHVDGLGTTDFNGISPVQPLPDHVKQIIQMNVENTYQRFINLVAEGRGLTPEQVDKIAQGRVWIGSDAVKNGLVDKLGDLDQAFVEAAKMAKLSEFKIVKIQPELSARDKLIREFFSETLALVPSTSTAHSSLLRMAASVLDTGSKAMAPLSVFQDPRGIYSYCPIEQ